jgi:hypothetical protein
LEAVSQSNAERGEEVFRKAVFFILRHGLLAKRGKRGFQRDSQKQEVSGWIKESRI